MDLFSEVNTIFKTLESIDIPFNRAIVSSTLKKRGVTYDSTELSEAVKDVARANNYSTSRRSFKEEVLSEIGETIFNEEELKDYLVKHGKPETPTEVKKYLRYVDLAARIISKYAPEVIEDNAA